MENEFLLNQPIGNTTKYLIIFQLLAILPINFMAYKIMEVCLICELINYLL